MNRHKPASTETNIVYDPEQKIGFQSLPQLPLISGKWFIDFALVYHARQYALYPRIGYIKVGH
jgi:hypothetical protein